MTTRVIAQLPPELTRILFELGNRQLVFLEGKEDVEVFETWFIEELAHIYFYACGGSIKVANLLEETLAKSHQKAIYGIIDRDFRPAAEVNATINDESAHLFILKRYALENYLLEPPAVWEELRIYPSDSFNIPDAEAMAKDLLALCNQLTTIMAANWAIYESTTDAKYFAAGYDLKRNNRDALIEQTAKKLNWDMNNTREKIEEKESIIQSQLSTIEMAYQLIDGKHLLHQILYQYTDEPKTKPRVEHFRRLLTRTIKEKVGLHEDILRIIKQRILL